jgi:MurNAc alpha-1-phosphate uridylyltransferase
MHNYKNIAAFIPAAGLGTRLQPLTNDKPKALVQFMGKTMLEGVLERLYQIGIRKFCVNIHHFPDLMRSKITRLNPKYDIVISDESDKLLDTGGGLVKAVKLLKGYESVLIHNVDVFANIDYDSFIQSHTVQKNHVSLAVSNRDTSRKLLFIEHILAGWKNFKTGEYIGKESGDDSYSAFSGIHMVNIDAIMKYRPSEEKFALIPWFVSLCNQIRIGKWEHDPLKWFDLGTTERISNAELQLKKEKYND